MSEAKHHWLVAGQIITANPKGIGHTRILNSLVLADEQCLTKLDIARTQDGLMRRFVTETEQEKGFQIVDVVILSINYLGLMTQEGFEGAFAAQVTGQDNQLAVVN